MVAERHTARYNQTRNESDTYLMECVDSMLKSRRLQVTRAVVARASAVLAMFDGQLSRTYAATQTRNAGHKTTAKQQGMVGATPSSRRSVVRSVCRYARGAVLHPSARAVRRQSRDTVTSSGGVVGSQVGITQTLKRLSRICPRRARDPVGCNP